jgi:hypothetical protein
MAQSSGVAIDVQCRRAAKTDSRAPLRRLPEQLRAKHHDKERVKIQLAPANLHWCSDAALEISNRLRGVLRYLLGSGPRPLEAYKAAQSAPPAPPKVSTGGAIWIDERPHAPFDDVVE